MTRFNPVRIVVVGCGFFGRQHALTLAGLAEAELGGIVDVQPSRLKAARSEFDSVPYFSDLEKAIAESGAEAWLVASTTESHVTVASQLLSQGQVVLLEKPIAPSLEEAEKLRPLVNSDSSNLMMGHIVLFNTESRKLLAEAAARPPLAYIDCVRHRSNATLTNYPGESPFHLTMVHDLYTTLALTGGAEPVNISAHVHHNEAGEMDLAIGLLEFPSGTVASLTASFLTTEGMGSDGFDRMEVFGRGWSARINPAPRPLCLWDERLHHPIDLEILADRIAPVGMMAEEQRCFCRVVRGMQTVPLGATYDDAMKVQRWLDEMERQVGK